MKGSIFLLLLLAPLLLALLYGYVRLIDGLSSIHKESFKSTETVGRTESTTRTTILPPPAVETLESPCSPTQEERQASQICQYYTGRHNLAQIYSLIRFHLPEATRFVDVGANKGLVSARWMQLWRPHWGIDPKRYVHESLKPYVEVVDPFGDATCGVTNMCAPQETPLARQEMAQASPIPLNYYLDPENDDPFQIHSFEPAKPFYDMHQALRQPNATFVQDPILLNPQIHKLWKFHHMAISDQDGEIYLETFKHEGSFIKRNRPPNVRLATLDTLAYQDQLFGPILDDDAEHRWMIDVFKIDAENVDVQAMAEASRLLLEQRIRVIMWETPNNAWPIRFLTSLGGSSVVVTQEQQHKEGSKTAGERRSVENASNTTSVNSFHELMELMDNTYGMTCYFPQTPKHHVRISGCEGSLSSVLKQQQQQVNAAEEQKKKPSCNPFISNALCVHRTMARSLYLALEEGALFQ